MGRTIYYVLKGDGVVGGGLKSNIIHIKTVIIYQMQHLTSKTGKAKRTLYKKKQKLFKKLDTLCWIGHTDL